MTRILFVLLFIISTCALVLVGGCLEHCPPAENIDVGILSVEKTTGLTGFKYDVYLVVKNHGNNVAENIIVLVTMDSRSSYEDIINATVEIELINPQESEERVVTFHSILNNLNKNNFFVTAYQQELLCCIDT